MMPDRGGLQVLQRARLGGAGPRCTTPSVPAQPRASAGRRELVGTGTRPVQCVTKPEHVLTGY